MPLRITHDTRYHVSANIGSGYQPIGTFDRVVFATGWRMDTSIFDRLVMDATGKYPALTSTFESVNTRNLYFIGALMHGRDHGRSSGGFIHGFRYLIQYLVRRWTDTVPRRLVAMGAMGASAIGASATGALGALADHIVRRWNTSSAMYQMHGVLGDCLTRDTYVEDTMLDTIDDTCLWLTLEFGATKTSDAYEWGKPRQGPASALLHPVVRLYHQHQLIETTHFDEQILASFVAPAYKEKLTRVLQDFANFQV
jgi:hypothetical protein